MKHGQSFSTWRAASAAISILSLSSSDMDVSLLRRLFDASPLSAELTMAAPKRLAPASTPTGVPNVKSLSQKVPPSPPDAGLFESIG